MSSPLARWITLAFCLLLVGSAPAAAQCPQPDSLDGPVGSCCTPALPSIPALPGVATDVLDICWQNCGVSLTQLLQAQWSPPQLITTPPACNIYLSNLLIGTSPTNIMWAGQMRLSYSRTWMAAGTSGALVQIWRFLVNGDLTALPPAGTPPCPVPACAPAFGNRVRFTGFLDFAQDCATGTFEFAWMLNHDCDRVDHRPGFPRAGIFHPLETYTFVGPGSSFVPSLAVAVEVGSSTQEAVRRLDLPLPPLAGICYFEEPLLTTQVTPVQQGCLPTLNPAPPQYVSSNFRVIGTCGTNVMVFPPYPYRFLSKALGSWTNPLAYPGNQELRWNHGGYIYADCTTVVRNEIFFGVTTIGGFPAFELTSAGPGAPLLPTFVDQGNSLGYPGLNVLFNVPYVSDHILNLNY